jgi:hypothetical protein
LLSEDSRSVDVYEAELIPATARSRSRPKIPGISRESAASGRERFAGLLSLALPGSLLLIALGGCERSSGDVSLSSPGETVATTSSEGLLQSALNLLREDEEGGDLFVRTEQQERSFGRVRELLNQWLQTGGAIGEQFDLEPGMRVRLAQDLEPAELADIEAERFTEGDAEHLRSGFVLRDVASWTQGDAAQNLDRARNIFEWIGRNIHPLVPQHDARHLSLGPYYTLLTGRGSPEERAWLFVALLRQLRIDAVVVAHAAADRQDHFLPWAVGVLDGGEIYLFDLERGRTVAASEGEGPLTLRAAADRPELLQSGWRDGERLDPSRPTVFLESDPAYWAPRMQLLQSKLAGDQAAVLSYDLADLASRVAEAAGESLEDRVRLWPLPVEVWRQGRTGDTNYEQRKLLELGSFAVFPVLVNTRLRQLRGEWERAIPELQTVNVAQSQLTKLNSVQQQFLDQAAEAATYWVGLCQHEKREFALAADWLQRYLDRYGEQGRWAPGARALLESVRGQQKAETTSQASGP